MIIIKERKKKRAPTQLLRIRNKELREARTRIDRLLAIPSYSMLWLSEALKDARNMKMPRGTTIRAIIDKPFLPSNILRIDLPTCINLIQDEAP